MTLYITGAFTINRNNCFKTWPSRLARNNILYKYVTDTGQTLKTWIVCVAMNWPQENLVQRPVRWEKKTSVCYFLVVELIWNFEYLEYGILRCHDNVHRMSDIWEHNVFLHIQQVINHLVTHLSYQLHSYKQSYKEQLQNENARQPTVGHRSGNNDLSHNYYSSQSKQT